MAERKRRKRRLPQVCDCGGKLEYAFGPGDYIAVGCPDCMPVVEVKTPPKPEHPAVRTARGGRPRQKPL